MEKADVLEISRQAQEELQKADAKHGPMAEQVEGFFTLLCEVIELGREVFRKNQDPTARRKEAIQVTAMGHKFVRDCCDHKDQQILAMAEPHPERKQWTSHEMEAELDDLADLCVAWKRNKELGRHPATIRAAMINSAAKISSHFKG